MAKYIAGHSGRLETDKEEENFGKPRAGEVIRIGNAHFNEGEEIPPNVMDKVYLNPAIPAGKDEATVKKAHAAALENDIKRGIIKRVEDRAAAKHEQQPSK